MNNIETIQNSMLDLKARAFHALDITNQNKVRYELEEIIELANDALRIANKMAEDETDSLIARVNSVI